MTCIVGIVDGNRVWIGGDSAGVNGLSMAIRRDPKVFRNRHVLIGYTTSFRMGQALMFGWEPPELSPSEDVFAWMCTSFIDSVRERLGQAGFRTIDNHVESGGTFLVGCAGRLFKVEDDFQVEEARANYNACGCGEDAALGALYATDTASGFDGSALSRIHMALCAAGAFSAGVSAPFVIKSCSTGGGTYSGSTTGTGGAL